MSKLVLEFDTSTIAPDRRDELLKATLGELRDSLAADWPKLQATAHVIGDGTQDLVLTSIGRHRWQAHEDVAA